MAAQQHRHPWRREEATGAGGAIKYGDVFEMSGEMADQPISPRDAAAMQSAENSAFGKTIKGGPASIMLQAAAKNVEAGLLPPHHASTFQNAPKVESNPWHESQASHERMESAISVEGMREGTTAGVTIGEALEAVAESIGDKPVDLSDAAAIQIAEMIATGSKTSLGAGLGAEAQAAATANAQLMYDEDKTKISEILQEATNMLTDDKAATKRDAERVRAAELEGPGVMGLEASSHRQSTTPGGVAEAIEAAARINEADK
ncbi:late embryogenesis abundant protein 32-like isoform X3 [Amaranthus tricolor]|uniref:late embryogenesis abundant protein 32-like isoform X3 n=1 Tax=Amaranthus tricolor TaxID=29722 RepID=UPI0025869BA2|nr:late embryogenesis abundant protein 32-like isoform X3 [Amaranthus tricolor]